jgi:hypothetical protein
MDNNYNNNIKDDNIKAFEKISSLSRVNANANDTNKTLGLFAKKKYILQRDLTTQFPRNNDKSRRIQTSPQTLNIKNSEIITLSTETIENQTQKFLTNHKVSFNNHSSYESAKYSSKPYGLIAGYAANTNQGQVRDYNEDRVSIILNVIKPNSRQNEEWPKVSFFSIYDGHGGNKCSDFLKENLHHYVCKIF